MKIFGDLPSLFFRTTFTSEKSFKTFKTSHDNSEAFQESISNFRFFSEFFVYYDFISLVSCFFFLIFHFVLFKTFF